MTVAIFLLMSWHQQRIVVFPTCVALLLPAVQVMLTEAGVGTATSQAVDGTNVQQLRCVQNQSQCKKKS